MIAILTYQDLLEVNQNDKDRIEFVNTVIQDHKRSELFKTGSVGRDYARKKNTTIMQFQKLLYTVTGNAVPDNYSANYKMASGFFKFFITQEYQYLLSNGVSWNGEDEPLGDDFDIKLQDAAKKALWGGVSFGFWNFDHVDVFDVTEFAPLYDEENGALRAGVRFWQIDKNKPLRATLYEEDGYTNYIWKDGKGEILEGTSKVAYQQVVRESEIDGTEIFDLQNYPTFPIVPLWGNPERQSEITGLQEQIDGYDLIKSGFCNTVDEASYVYWTLKNAGGMDDIDLAVFIERMKTVHAATLDDAVQAESHAQEVPHAAREALLDRLRADLFESAMALDTKNIAGGNITATQIQASYESLDAKTNEFEYCVIDFINGLLKVAGKEDEPTFTRSRMINVQEQVQTIIQGGTYLDDEYVTRKILDLLGDGDKAEEMIALLAEDDMTRLTGADVDSNGVSGDEEGNAQQSNENAVQSIVERFKSGDMNREDAISALMKEGMTREDAERLLREEE